MIDAARALRSSIEAEIERLHAEEERLRWFAGSLDTFIEQAGTASSESSVPTVGAADAPDTPEPAGSPPVGAARGAEQPARKGRVRSGPAVRTTSPADEAGTSGVEAAASAGHAPAASSFACSCGRSFDTQRGLSRHWAADRRHEQATDRQKPPLTNGSAEWTRLGQ